MKNELTRCWMRWILELLILYWATNVLILQFAGNTRQVELQSACSLMLVALSVLDLLLPRHYMMSYTHTHTHCTLKSPLSMMSMILYCWLMSFSSTRFLSAFSWSFLLVSNSRLSDRRRSGGQTLSTSRETHPWRCLSSTLSDLHTHTQTSADSIWRQLCTPSAEGYRSPGWSRVSVGACRSLPSWVRQRRAPGPLHPHSAWSAGGGREALFWKQGWWAIRHCSTAEYCHTVAWLDPFSLPDSLRFHMEPANTAFFSIHSFFSFQSY